MKATDIKVFKSCSISAVLVIFAVGMNARGWGVFSAVLFIVCAGFVSTAIVYTVVDILKLK